MTGQIKKKGESHKSDAQDSELKYEKPQKFWSHFWDICVFSWRSIFSHPWMLIFLFLFNIGFLFLFSFYDQSVGSKLGYTLGLMSDLFQRIYMASQNPDFVSSFASMTRVDIIMSEPVMSRLLSDIITLLAILAMVAYVVYTFFQSTSVRFIGWMVLDKKPFSLWSFIKLNAIWFVSYIFSRLVIFAIDLGYSFFSDGKQVLDNFAFLYVVLHVFLFYFAFISYSFLEDGHTWRAVRNSLKFGLGKPHYYLLNFLLVGLFIIPATNGTIIAPILNVLNPLGYLGYGLQFAIMFLMYTLITANNFTITHEVASCEFGQQKANSKVDAKASKVCKTEFDCAGEK